MTSYIVEHRYKGNYVMETISGVEDLDISMYKDLLGVWVCESQEELQVMEKQIREMRNARSGEQA
tara:strand:+ start:3094 stop:3288 length:195 start_codon:yes stop_codon:yes gene_type:complete